MYLADEKGNAINKTYPLQVDATMANGVPAEYISDTAEHKPGDGYVYCAVDFRTDTVFDTIVPALTGTITEVVFTAGSLPLYQELTSIKLVSGTVIAYKRAV